MPGVAWQPIRAVGDAEAVHGNAAPMALRQAWVSTEGRIGPGRSLGRGRQRAGLPSAQWIITPDEIPVRRPPTARIGDDRPGGAERRGVRGGVLARQNGRVPGIGRLSRVVFDAVDARQLAAFYAELTGWQPTQPEGDGLMLRTPAGPALGFQPAPDHVPPQWPGQERPQQIHLDLDVENVAQAAARAAGLKATELGGGPYWATLADPAGHPFDLCQTATVAPMSRLWVSIDAPDPPALARFYSVLLGLEITHNDQAGAAIGFGGPVTVFFQLVAAYRPPRWPDPAHPQQAHLDVLVDDIDRAKSALMKLGADPLGDGADGPVLADPAGHPFCLHQRAEPSTQG